MPREAASSDSEQAAGRESQCTQPWDKKPTERKKYLGGRKREKLNGRSWPGELCKGVSPHQRLGSSHRIRDIWPKKLMSCLSQELNPRYHCILWPLDVNPSALGLSFGHFILV